MENNSADRRIRLFIEKDFQVSFLVYSVGIALVVAGIYFASNYYFIDKFVERGASLGLPAGHVYFKFIEEQKSMMTNIYAITTILSTAFILFFGLHLSNRVAGPIHKLREHLSALTAGKYREKIQFRKKDYFSGLADDINTYVESRKK